MATKLPRLPTGWLKQPQLFERYWDGVLTTVEKNIDTTGVHTNEIDTINTNLQYLTSKVNGLTIGGSSSGSVTSVSGTGTVSGLTLTGTVTTSGNLTLGGTLNVLPSNFASQTANTFLASPDGASGVPSFRSIVVTDMPTSGVTAGTYSFVTLTVDDRGRVTDIFDGYSEDYDRQVTRWTPGGPGAASGVLNVFGFHGNVARSPLQGSSTSLPAMTGSGNKFIAKSRGMASTSSSGSDVASFYPLNATTATRLPLYGIEGYRMFTIAGISSNTVGGSIPSGYKYFIGVSAYVATLPGSPYVYPQSPGGSIGGITAMPSNFVNIIGIGCDDDPVPNPNLSLFHSGLLGPPTKVSLGSGFIRPRPGIDFDRFELYVPPGGENIQWKVTRLNTGAVASGVITTNVPSTTEGLQPMHWLSNGAGGGAVTVLNIFGGRAEVFF